MNRKRWLYIHRDSWWWYYLCWLLRVWYWWLWCNKVLLCSVLRQIIEATMLTLGWFINMFAKVVHVFVLSFGYIIKLTKDHSSDPVVSVDIEWCKSRRTISEHFQRQHFDKNYNKLKLQGNRFTVSISWSTQIHAQHPEKVFTYKSTQRINKAKSIHIHVG
jgi:hypothetical protein